MPQVRGGQQPAALRLNGVSEGMSHFEWAKQKLIVTLSAEDLQDARHAGEMRTRSQREANRPDGRRGSKPGPEYDQEGARAEKAVSLAFGLDWDGKYKNFETWESWRLTHHDVGDLEVKTTALSDGCLVVRQYEEGKLDAPFVLAVLDEDTSKVLIVGWLYGREVCIERYWTTRDGVPEPCFMVPQGQLKPISELLRLMDSDLAAQAPDLVIEPEISADEWAALIS